MFREHVGAWGSLFAVGRDSDLFNWLRSHSVSGAVLAVSSWSLATAAETPWTFAVGLGVSVATGYIVVANRAGRAAVKSYFQHRAEEEAANKRSLSNTIADLQAQITLEARRSHRNERKARRTLHEIGNALQIITSERDALRLELSQARALLVTANTQTTPGSG